MAIQRFSSVSRFSVGILLPFAFAAMLSGCANASQKVVNASGPKVDAPQAFGKYLAAESAAATSDTTAAADYYLETLKVDPTNILLQQKAYSALIGSGRFDEAKAIAEKLMDEKTTTNLPQFFWVLGLIKDGKYDKAVTALTQIPDAGFQTLLNPLVRAWVLAAEGKTDLAVAALEPLDQTPVFRPFRRNHRAFIYAFSGNKTAAEIAFKESLAADQRGNLRVVLAYGRLLADMGRTYEAKQLYREFEQLYPSNLAFGRAERELDLGVVSKPFIASPSDGLAEALYGMSIALAADNASAPAAYYLRLATFLKPGFSDAYLMLGRLFEADKVYDQALISYDLVPPADTLYSEARLRKAWVLEDMKLKDEAAMIMNALVAANPESLEYRISLADMLRGHEKYAEAIENYNQVLKLAGAPSKGIWPIYYSRGIAYERTGQWPLAEADFLKALELSPDQPQVLNYLGYSWIEQGVNVPKAQAMLEKAVELSPNDGFVLDSLGWALFRQKKYAEAVTLLERAVLQQPEDPTLNDHLGDAYWANGRRIEAKFQWRHAISLGALPEEVAKIETKIKKGLDLKPALATPTPASQDQQN